MRVRICVGMKRYFHQKNVEGLLSNSVRALQLGACPRATRPVAEQAGLHRPPLCTPAGNDIKICSVLSSDSCSVLCSFPCEQVGCFGQLKSSTHSGSGQCMSYSSQLVVNLNSRLRCSYPRCCSPQALRILSHSCDSEIDNPDTPLALWDTLEKEVCGRTLDLTLTFSST